MNLTPQTHATQFEVWIVKGEKAWVEVVYPDGTRLSTLGLGTTETECMQDAANHADFIRTYYEDSKGLV